MYLSIIVYAAHNSRDGKVLLKNELFQLHVPLNMNSNLDMNSNFSS